MCISFQYRKHLSLGRGGIILLDKKDDYEHLKKMSYDGRSPDTPWMETKYKNTWLSLLHDSRNGTFRFKKLPNAIATPPKSWTINDWPDVFQNGNFQRTKSMIFINQIKNKLISSEGIKYFKNFLSLFFEKSIRLIVSFLVISQISRYIGPDNYGVLSLVESLFSILIAVSALGLDPIIIKIFS